MRRSAGRFGWLVAGTLPLLGAMSGPAQAEPVVDQALSGVKLLTQKSCLILKVNFNFLVRYDSHFPLEQGQELRIAVRPIDRAQAASLVRLPREAVRVPENSIVPIVAIDFEANQPNGPVLRVLFERPASFKVAQGADFTSIVIAVADKGPAATCKPEYAVGPLDEIAAPGAAAGSRPKDRPVGKASPADLRAAGAAMDEGRAALKKNKYDEAIRLFTKVLRLPENEYSAEAQELLGVARQKGGNMAEARAEYEDYLRRYPAGEGNERVRQRLAGITTAQDGPGEKLRVAKGQGDGAKFERTGETTWSVSGSASVFYIRDDSFRTLRDPSLAPIPNEDKDAHRVHQNTFLTSLDVIGAWSNDQFKSKIRFSGSQESNLDSGAREITGVAAAFAETTFKDWDVMARLGRQTRSSGGVLGRFDGGLVSWQADPSIRFNVVGGSPVESRRDMPFKNERFFYGPSVDFGPFFGGLEATLFFIEQRDRWWVDRQAVGTELRYIDPQKSAYATIDYDVHFQELNLAIFSGSWTLFDKSTIYGSADYRKTPFLTAWNAIQGQPFLTLYDMLRLQTKDEIDRFAIDRTATYKSAMIGFSRPIWDKLQVSMDATAVDITGTIASGGVLATPAVGPEFYYSAQLIGTGIFKDGDLFIAGVRYADLVDSKLYVLDLSARYPLIADFRVSPRVRFGYRAGDFTDLKEFTVLPTVLIDYYLTKDINFEIEVGTKWTRLERFGTTETTTDLFLTAGVRYDFYADDKTRCFRPWPPCP